MKKNSNATKIFYGSYILYSKIRSIPLTKRDLWAVDYCGLPYCLYQSLMGQTATIP